MNSRFSGFVNGAATMLGVFILAAAAMGGERFGSALLPGMLPPVGWGALAIIGLLLVIRDMCRSPEEVTVISRKCANCDSDT